MERTYKVSKAKLPISNGARKILRWHNNILLMAVEFAVLAMFVQFAVSHCFNFDIWYMLATGREILANGIPYENVFAQQEGMQIIVQQWFLCIVNYVIYSQFGFAGLAWWICAMTIVLMVSLYRLGRLKKRDKFGAEIILALMIPVLYCMSSYITLCSSIYSMIAYCWVVFFCEKYRQTGQYRWLAFIIPLAIVHSSFHMSLAIFDVVIVGCYWIPDFLKPLHARGHLKKVSFAESSYKRWPVLIAMVGTALALCVNPYGIRGALYVLLSYGAADYANVIPEMDTFAPASYPVYGTCCLIVVGLVFLFIGKRGFARIDLPLTVLVLGTTYMMFQHTRNIWLPMIFAFALIIGTTRGWSWDMAKIPKLSENGDRRKLAKGARTLSIILAIVICASSTIYTGVKLATEVMPSFNQAEKNDNYSPRGLMAQIVKEAGDEDVKIFNPLRLGGYIEWVGYKPYIDTRVEVWNSAINGVGVDYYNDYVDMVEGNWSNDQMKEFFDQNDFDYIIVDRDSAIEDYMKSQDEYRSVMGTDDFTLWRKA